MNVILSDDKQEMAHYEGDKKTSNLENAYKSLRENVSLTKAQEEALIDFVDRSVTCTLNPELAAKMIDTTKTKSFGLKVIETRLGL